MTTYDRSRRAAVVGVVAVTALLVPVAGVAGYAAGRELREGPGQEALATPSASASPTPTASASPTASPSPAGVPTELSKETRDLATRATVRLSPPFGRSFGSGSVVSSDGLILTNAHVAQPTAPGLARHYGTRVRPQLDPERIVVSTTTGDGPAQPTYLADVLAVDGHLDLAVLKVSTYADGRPLPADLELPHVRIGSVDDLSLGDDLTVYGFPGINSGAVLTARNGIVGAFLPDPHDLVPGSRFNVETTADFSPGNSGGMALSNDGRLVGVPSEVYDDEEGNAQAHKMRAVDLAEPLLAAATSGEAYSSPYVPAATGQERAEDLGWAEGTSCSSPSSEAFDDESSIVLGRVRLTGMADEEDMLVVLRESGQVVRVVAAAYDPSEACYGVALPKDAPEDGNVVPGDYELEVLVGRERRSVLRSSVVVQDA